MNTMKTRVSAIVLLVVVLAGYVPSPASESKPCQSAVETVPFGQMKQWLHMSRADLDEVSAESGQLDFSTRFAYEGDYALRWKYKPGDAWVWKCNLNNLGPSPTFYLAALEPQIKGNSPSTFHLQFLDAKSKVACECDMLLARPFWNRCIIRLSSNNGMPVGIKNLTGTIPTTVSAIRLIPTGKQAGELFVGSWLLTEQWMVRRDSVAEVDGFPEPSIPDASKLPEPSTAEVSAAKVMAETFEKGFMADCFNVIGKPYETIVTEALSHYKVLNLRRTPEGMAGRNLFMEQEIHRGHWCSCLAPKKYQVAAYESLAIPKNTLHAYADFGNGTHDTVATYETGTTLFQDQWTGADAKGKTRTPLFFNAAESLNTFPLERRESLASAKWLINRQGVGFYLYSGQQLSLRRAEQQFPDSLGKKESKGKFTTAWLSHGSAPKDASYRYLMRVGVTPETMAALAAAMKQNAPYEIRQQDDTAHIVASKSDATRGYVVFKANAALRGDEVTVPGRKSGEADREFLSTFGLALFFWSSRWPAARMRLSFSTTPAVMRKLWP